MSRKRVMMPDKALHTIRQRRKFHLDRRSFVEQLRIRDSGLYCRACGKQFAGKHDKTMTVDHIVPISQGGNHMALSNLQLCVECQGRKEKALNQQELTILIWAQGPSTSGTCHAGLGYVLAEKRQ
ncbi:HNH endonuclease [Candidatus Nitrososphaera evergladensis]|uniref:HNH endonuclease n=1 Tax=Candidatus Nitrososphaera evergladensis TaxID=1459637 RepID=UPI0011E596CA